MRRDTVLFGAMNFPDTREEIVQELKECREIFLECSTYMLDVRFIQARIDELESILDEFRRSEDV